MIFILKQGIAFGQCPFKGPDRLSGIFYGALFFAKRLSAPSCRTKRWSRSHLFQISRSYFPIKSWLIMINI